MPLIYRPAQAQDLVTTDALVVASINELTNRHGFGPMAIPSPPNFQSFSLADGPDGLWIAEDDGDIRGFAWSWVCGDIWFLAQLFVDPTQQGRGIGNELIKLTLEQARKSGAAHKVLITFAFNRISQGLYIRHGLFPKAPVYFFDTARGRVKEKLQGPPFRTMPIDNSVATMAKLVEIDRHAIGVSREKHHRYLARELTTRGVLLCAGDECVGYSYIASNGHIGPLAVMNDQFLGDAFMTALNIAANGSSERISAFVPGTCYAALGLAVDHGMRITFPMLLMASPGFGAWTGYLPRNPGFM